MDDDLSVCTRDTEDSYDDCPPIVQRTTSYKNCLYLPGVCLVVYPTVSAATGPLNMRVNPWPSNFDFNKISSSEVGRELYLDWKRVIEREEQEPPLEIKQTYQPRSVPPTQILMLARLRRVRAKLAKRVPNLFKSVEHHKKLTTGTQAFENTSTSVAASQMRNALTALADTCTDPNQKEVCQSWEIV
jgi:hypothetical protein